MKDVFIPGRPAAISVTRATGENLKHVSRETGVRVFRNSPESAIVQIRLDAEKSHTYASASLDIDELKALRAGINMALAELEPLAG